MVYEARDDVLVYKGHERTIETLAWWCTRCEEAIFSGPPLADHEKAFEAFKAEIDGLRPLGEVALRQVGPRNV
jgi:YgiT-type zinc finger domain-containing protein